MSHNIEAWIIVFAAATALLVLIQVIILVGFFFMFRRIGREAKAIGQHLRADGIDPYDLARRARHFLHEAEAAVHTGMAAGASATELITRASAILDQVEKSVRAIRGYIDLIRHTLAEPLHEYRAVAAGIRSVLSVLGGDHHASSPAAYRERTVARRPSRTAAGSPPSI